MFGKREVNNMDKEDLERTGMLSKIIEDDEVSMEERLIEILDRIEYNDFPIWKKNQINNLINDIKKSKKQDEKEKNNKTVTAHGHVRRSGPPCHGTGTMEHGPLHTLCRATRPPRTEEPCGSRECRTERQAGRGRLHPQSQRRSGRTSVVGTQRRPRDKHLQHHYHPEQQLPAEHRSDGMGRNAEHQFAETGAPADETEPKRPAGNVRPDCH